MLLVIDNYDSFTYNLVQLIGSLGVELVVKRNDEIGLQDIQKMQPERIVISPGPCTPNEAGISVDFVRRLGVTTRIRGVCRGQRAMGQGSGGQGGRARRIMHGKTSP